ncbi:MAG: GNAT family N-acetyltransferase [Microthrixaceae bacterium]
MSADPPQEGVRAATIADAPRIVELIAAAVSELSSGRGGRVWARREARVAPYEPLLEAQLGDPACHVLVGTLDDVVLAFGVARVETLHDGGRLGLVEDLYTEPLARELGLGEAMMQELVTWCATQGCFGVDSLALPGDRHTKNFFESFGLVARAILVHRPLP